MWSQEHLILAWVQVTDNEITKKEAHRLYNICPRTLTRRIKTGNKEKSKFGPYGVFSNENEKNLVGFIQHLRASGFPPDGNTIRTIAYQFAEEQHIKHNFSRKKQMAGLDWLDGFLERNPQLAINKLTKSKKADKENKLSNKTSKN